MFKVYWLHARQLDELPDDTGAHGYHFICRPCSSKWGLLLYSSIMHSMYGIVIMACIMHVRCTAHGARPCELAHDQSTVPFRQAGMNDSTSKATIMPGGWWQEITKICIVTKLCFYTDMIGLVSKGWNTSPNPIRNDAKYFGEQWQQMLL